MQNIVQYLGGLSWATEPGRGRLELNDQVIELQGGTKQRPFLVVKVQVKAIASVDVTSEQVAKSKVGNLLVFGAIGALATKNSEDRGSMLVHMKSGQVGYFTFDELSQHQILSKLTPWLHATGIRNGPPEIPAPAQQAGMVVSVADEIAKLGALKTQGLLTEEEFAAQKAKLLA